MATDKILILDELIDQDIAPDYNLLKDKTLSPEDLIEIKEKKLPGKKQSFNNRADAVTKEVFVTGLVLSFTQDLSDSRLNSIMGRNDIEHLYLYADTIMINEKLSFPQANVTVCCRQLIIEESGSICTTAEANPIPFAMGKGEDPRKPGADGEPSGSITLLCQTIDNRRKNEEAVFITAGIKAQNGEKGGLKEWNRRGDVPLSWSDIQHPIINHDSWVGTEKNWHWADFSDNDKKKVYYADIHAMHYGYLDPKRRPMDTTRGDKNMQNQDNGFDAIASGKGGNGGPGGNLNYLEFKSTGKKVNWNLNGGEEGKSDRVEGGKKTKDSSYYHIYIKAFHDDINYNGNKKNKDGSIKESFKPQCYVTATLTSRDGNAAQGPNGSRGGNGNAIKLDAAKTSWLQPALMEAMLAYAKNSFRDGERKKAKWILDIYLNAVKTLPAALKEDMRMASLLREADVYAQRIAQNLDFYGYPPGWVPRLSVLSNLQILVASRRDLAQLLYFANRLLKQDEANKLEVKDLDFAIKELKKSVTAAQADVVAAFDALPEVKNQIGIIETQVKDQLIALRDLKQKIMDEVKDKAQQQALFTGSFEILAGVCSLIPVGQPFVGQIGGGIMKQISKINIDPDNPVKEGLNFAGKLSGEVGGFMEKNKDKIATSVNADLTKEIDKGKKDLNAFSGQIDSMTAEMTEAENALKGTLKDQELAILREKIRLVRTEKGNPMRIANDYGDIVAHIDEMQALVNNARDIANDQKTELSGKLAKLKTEKKTLSDKLKAREKQKADREKNVETAGKVIKGLTDGISGIASGIQTMMVEFDENDPEVQKKFEAIKKSPQYKDKFESINKKIAEINKQKLPLVEKLLRLEQRIQEGVQRINNNLVQWSTLNDQRVSSVQYGLMPATRATLKSVVNESWDLLMLECYYLTKSYQYRFLEKIKPVEFGIKALLEDIEKFREGKDPGTMTEAAYTDLFNKVLKIQFQKLAKELLIKRQTGNGKLYNEISVPVITAADKNAAGEPILEKLNQFRQVNFRLEDIKNAKHGTADWFHYRITSITFQRIVVETSNPNVSFDFGIRHSGDSIIRTADKKLYYFTSRSSRESSTHKPALLRSNTHEAAPQLDLQVHSWNASYNGADRDKPTHGLTNSTDSTEDDRLLAELLQNFELETEYNKAGKPYREHYPGGSSLLTLIIYDTSPELEFKIKEVEFKVGYEVLR